MHSRMPDFQPKAILDFGCGPGTGMWVSKDQWSSVEKFTGVDISDDMLQACKYFSSRSFI
jgi:ribosomal protein RSM22 (predicted rRNA methylase)